MLLNTRAVIGLGGGDDTLSGGLSLGRGESGMGDGPWIAWPNETGLAAR
jgi:hypothetical protein